MLSVSEARNVFRTYLANNKHSQEQGKKLEDFIVRFHEWFPLMKKLDVKNYSVFANELNLPARDKGIDLMGCDGKGIYPIQAKNYVGKNKIHGNQVHVFCNEVRNFNVLYSQQPIKNAFFIFNGNLTDDASERINETNKALKLDGELWQIKEIDLDDIFPDLYDHLSAKAPDKLASQEDFNLFLTGNRVVKPEAKKLRGYQQKAVAKAEEHYLKNRKNRGQMIMACGTGKTLTSLAITKKITKPNSLILFLVPTLDLMRQTIKVARIDMNFDFEGFAVCSDQTTIKNDEINVPDDELSINEIFRNDQHMINYYQDWRNKKNFRSKK